MATMKRNNKKAAGPRTFGSSQKVTASVIRAWDPYDLFPEAPIDEYDVQIAKVAAESRQIRSATDAAEIIARVFAKSFDAEGFTPESCAVVGNDLHAALWAHGLISSNLET